ncbi:MAG: hypothetical protein KA538_06990 [Azonexus sp.]|jgi:hypothetical protein|nr:hypothetical protein [Azonexus sp.]
MADFQTSLPLVFELARKVQETGRAKDLSRTFSGTEEEISSYHSNLRSAADGLADAVCVIGQLMTKQDGEGLEDDQMFRLGWLLVTIGEMSNVLSGELFAISERSQAGGVHG